MLKRVKLTYFLLLAVALPLMIACSNDDVATGNETVRTGREINVHLRVSQASLATTRASEDDEMMNAWTVVVVNDNDNTVAAIYACKLANPQEIDDLVELPAEGTYRFYSFANMSPTKVMELLNILPAIKTEGTTVSIDKFNTDAFPKDKVVRISTNNQVTEDAVKSIAVKVNGNGFDPSSKNDNGFDSYGIPMSNVQKIEVKDDGDMIDLVVIRMLAKVKLQIYNDSGSDITIKSVTLTNLTANISSNSTSTTGNLMLLPYIKSEEGSNTMTPIHSDIQPNLNAEPEQEDLTLDNINSAISPSANQYSPVKGTPVEFTFYVNESESPNNNFGYYFLKLTLSKKADNNETVTEERYALIDNKGATTDDDGKWLYIARNDYRIIPIVLDDYKLDIIPYDFPAIGVYPASVKEEDGIYTITFHDYGHFHLLPLVTRFSDSYIVPFSASAAEQGDNVVWGFLNNDEGFSSSWESWTDYAKSAKYDNEIASDPFYRPGYGVVPGDDGEVNPPVDGDEVGGQPVWYPNTEGSPQWMPNTTIGYQPFIFGYIEDPGKALSADKKVYHEFSIYLYKPGSEPQQMTYRLYMILDTKQMMHARRSLGASAARHTHGQ